MRGETVTATACWAAGLLTGIFGTLAAVNLGWL